MRAVIQRVTKAKVRVEGRATSSIEAGLVVLLGAGQGDTSKDVDWMADKIVQLRIFADDQGKMNRSLLEVGGKMIAVSQFTLYGDCRKGRRPSFVRALEPSPAEELCRQFVERIESKGVQCGTGVFGAHMLVELANDGPVTFLLDSEVSRRQGTGGFSNWPD